MTTNKKKTLIIQTHAPFGSSIIQESIDLVLALGTFDQDVSLLLQGDACFQLIPNASPELIARKNTSKMLNALPIYGIENILVCAESLCERKLEILAIPTIKRLNKFEIKQLINDVDNVIQF